MAPLASTHRPRKHSSVVRREEKVALLREIEALRTRLRVLRRQSKKRVESFDGDSEDDDLYSKDPLTATARRQDIWIAGARGLLIGQTTSCRRVPLYAPLRLPKDPGMRRAALLNAHPVRLQEADAFLRARCSAMDPMTPFSSQETFQHPATGDHSAEYFDMTPFPGIDSVADVYDALRFLSFNLEICVSEYLGNLTIREDSGDDELTQPGDAFSSVRRMRSIVKDGVTTEGVQAIFGRMVVEDAGSYALLAVQPVKDDLCSSQQRDDVQFVKAIVAVRIFKPPPEHCVVMAKWVRCRVFRSRTASADDVRDALKFGSGRWFDVLKRVVWERVYAGEKPPELPL